MSEVDLGSIASALDRLGKASGDSAEIRPASRGAGFADLMANTIERANSDQLEAEKQARALADGKADVVDSMLALTRADLSLRFVVSLRNRALEAYREIMRLQV